jgi:hypothetical protein
VPRGGGPANMLKIAIFVRMQKRELYDVISGKNEVRFGAIIQTIASDLRHGPQTGPKAEDTKHVKKQEAERLENIISEKNLWIENIDFTRYVSEGAEQRVYLKNADHVLKLNDSIYYNSWADYLHNLLLHNFFFADTAYELIGFTKEDNTLYAVVQQPYVSITQPTDLNDVKRFLEKNGFRNTRNNDYLNPELGIILEDLHDENVLTQGNILYFIDTVFYLTENFWME